MLGGKVRHIRLDLISGEHLVPDGGLNLCTLVQLPLLRLIVPLRYFQSCHGRGDSSLSGFHVFRSLIIHLVAPCHLLRSKESFWVSIPRGTRSGRADERLAPLPTGFLLGRGYVSLAVAASPVIPHDVFPFPPSS